MRRIATLAVLALGVSLIAVPAAANGTPVDDLPAAQAFLKAAFPASRAAESANGVTLTTTGGMPGQVSSMQLSADGRTVWSPGGVTTFSAETARNFAPVGYYIEVMTHPSSAPDPEAPLSLNTRALLRHLGLDADTMIGLPIRSAELVKMLRRLSVGTSTPWRFARLVVDKASSGRVVDADTVELSLTEDEFTEALFGAPSDGGGGTVTPLAEEPEVTMTFDVDTAGRLSMVTLGMGGPTSTLAVTRYAAPKAVIPPVGARVSSKVRARLEEATSAQFAALMLISEVRRLLGAKPTQARLRLADGLDRTAPGAVATSRYVNKSVLVTGRGGGVSWTSRIKIRRGKVLVSSLKLGTRINPTRITAAVPAPDTRRITSGIAQDPTSPVATTIIGNPLLPTQWFAASAA